MKQTHSKVDAFIKAEKKWKSEIELLREIALDSGLTEEFKWSLPCYSHDGKNVAIIQNFKNICALMFFNGSSLKDPKKLLRKQGENSNAPRRLEFTSADEVKKNKATIKALIKEAMNVDVSTVKAAAKKVNPPSIPAEFQSRLSENKKLKTAFEALTPGRQRLYLMHFSSAKQSATRSARVDKCIPRILKGLGLND